MSQAIRIPKTHCVFCVTLLCQSATLCKRQQERRENRNSFIQMQLDRPPPFKIHAESTSRRHQMLFAQGQTRRTAQRSPSCMFELCNNGYKNISIAWMALPSANIFEFCHRPHPSFFSPRPCWITQKQLGLRRKNRPSFHLAKSLALKEPAIKSSIPTSKKK